MVFVLVTSKRPLEKSSSSETRARAGPGCSQLALVPSTQSLGWEHSRLITHHGAGDLFGRGQPDVPTSRLRAETPCSAAGRKDCSPQRCSVWQAEPQGQRKQERAACLSCVVGINPTVSKRCKWQGLPGCGDVMGDRKQHPISGCLAPIQPLPTLRLK